ncbi:hypothetical protein [Nibrella saemangeumensis]
MDQAQKGVDEVAVLEDLQENQSIIPKQIQTDDGSEFISKDVDVER